MNYDQTNKSSTAPFDSDWLINTYQFGINLDFLLNLASVLLVAPFLMTDRTLINALMCVYVCVFSQIQPDACKKRKEKSKGKEEEGRQQSSVS